MCSNSIHLLNSPHIIYFIGSNCEPTFLVVNKTVQWQLSKLYTRSQFYLLVLRYKQERCVVSKVVDWI